MRIVGRLFVFFVLLCGGLGLTAYPAAAASPTLSVDADGWHVRANLAGVTRFTFMLLPAGGEKTYYRGVTSPFVVDPLVWGKQQVTVSASPTGAGDWSTGVTFTVPEGKPALTVSADKWHVTAALPNAETFVFMVKPKGGDPVYAGNTASTFLVDPWTYGGKEVTVSARAQGKLENPWPTGVTFTVPAPTAGTPVVDLRPDHRHVVATLPGTTRFVWAVHADGMDPYHVEGPSTFALDPAVYAGKTVRVSAAAAGTSAWSAQVTTVVPPVKYFGVCTDLKFTAATAADARGLGITLNRLDFSIGEPVATMDAKVARNVENGITPLPLLVEYKRPISQFDLAAWQTWASAVVARYGPGGDFWAGRTDGNLAPVYFELLNEPFVYSFYGDQKPEPAAYATFFKTVATAARAANPRARFLLAAESQPYQVQSQVYSTRTWDADFLAAPDAAAALAAADAVTVHPYNSYQEALGWGRAQDVHADFPSKPVWLTEIGFRLGHKLDDTVLTEEGQAAYLQRSLADFVDWPWAQAYLWFEYNDYSETSEETRWGLVNWNGSHRLSYGAYRSFIS